MSVHARTMRRHNTAGHGAHLSPWFVLVAALLALATALLAAPRAAESSLVTPEHTRHDFGQVPIDGGPIAAQIPLAIQGEPVVSGLGTT